jgi:selenide,water dikinase
LADALKGLPQSVHPNLLVGFNKADDAGVWRIDDKTALVQTVDFFPPIVDDPYFFGQIAAANALSDVYAMGGRPLTALNIVAFPSSTMPGQILADILRGGLDKIEEAGAVVVGGHSIKDKELKYGVAVTGIVDPNRVVTNSGARVGDKLFLTKSLGTGIITTGIKRNVVSAELTKQVIRQMAELNRTAAELMVQFGVTSATDITGFGLLGHAYEMAHGSGVGIRLHSGAIPLLPEAVRLAGEGVNPGGANDNRGYLEDKVTIAATVDPNLAQVLYDPQTSGGLLIAIPAAQAEQFAAALREHSLPDRVIGEVIAADPPHITVE